MRYETRDLIKTFKKNGKIVLGLDFDNTIYPLIKDDYTVNRCLNVRTLIELVRDKVTLCLWTVAADWSECYKRTICEDLYNIKIDYMNESPLYPDPTVRKPIFDLILDDKAGLDEAMEILKEFHKETGTKAL